MPPKPPRPTGTASSSEAPDVRRKSSTASNKLNLLHVPANPSQLRESYVPSEGSPSPKETMSRRLGHDEAEVSSNSQRQLREPEFESDGIHPAPDRASVHSNDGKVPAENVGATIDADLESTMRTRLLSHKDWDQASGCGSEHCSHGTFSPRPATHRSYGSISSDVSRDGFGGRYPRELGDGPGGSVDPTHALLGDAIADGLLRGGTGNKMSTTRFLANRHGIKHQKTMCVSPSHILRMCQPCITSVVVCDG